MRNSENQPDVNSEVNPAESPDQAKQFNRDHYSSGAHIVVNKLIIRELGLEAAVFLGDLLSKEKYFEDHKMLDGEGYFFNSEEDRESSTKLSPYKQSKAIKLFESLGILYPVSRKGSPPKQRFKFNHSILKNLRINPKKFKEESNNKNKENNKEIESKDSINDFEKSSSKKTLSSGFQRQAPISPKKSSKSVRKDSSPDYVQKATGEWAILSSWNKLPRPARQYARLNTKTVRRAVQYLKQMRNGTFGDLSRVQWDAKWMDKHKIDRRAFSEKKWTFREICKTIEGPLGDMYKEGFWPFDKSSLPKSLTDALYNPRTRTSFFVLAFYDSPGHLKVQSVKDLYPSITGRLTREGFIQPAQMGVGNWKEYFNGVRGLEEYLKKIDWSNYGAKQMFGLKGENLYALIMQYVWWMKGEAPDLLPPSKVSERFHIGMIRPDFWMWRAFMESVNRYWGRVFLCVPEMEEK
jgi:hypothetical protein